MDIAHLYKLMKRHKKYCELQCNQGLLPAQEHARDKIEAELIIYCAAILGVKAEAITFSYDPRCWTVEIRMSIGNRQVIVHL